MKRFRLRIPALAIAFVASGLLISRAAPPPQKAASAPEIRGLVIYASDWGNPYTAPFGVYSVPTDASMDFSLVYKVSAGANYGFYGSTMTPDFFAGFKVYSPSPYYSQYTYYTLDPETGQPLKTASSQLKDMPYDLAYDATTGNVYGLADSEDRSKPVLARYDLRQDSYTITRIGELPTPGWNSIAVDKNGEIYAIKKDGDLYKIDKETAAVTRVGATGYVPSYNSSAAFDPMSGKLYWSVNPSDRTGFICEVDTRTGAATKLFTYPKNNQVTGLYVMGPSVADGAPDAPENLSVSFTGGSLSGSVSFTAPTTLVNGNTGSGEIGWTLLVNGGQAASGTTTFGGNVTIPYTCAASGMTRFGVLLSNDAGFGPKAEVSKFVGPGIPKAVSSPKALYDDATGAVTISWNKGYGTTDGGYIDMDAVTYTVKRDDNLLVSEGSTSTSCTDNITEPSELTRHTYTITANYAGKESLSAVSNEIVLGHLLPPYLASFDKDLCDFTVLDYNDDGKKWYYSSSDGGRANINYNSSKEMDDWLFSVPLRLEKGNLYRLTFKAYASSSSKERIEVKMGRNPVPSEMKKTLVSRTDVGSRSSQPEFEVYINPEQTGNYFIGFHGCSPANRYYLCLDDVAVSAPISARAPEAVSNLTATPGAGGAKTITVAFDAPSRNLLGESLDALTKIEVMRDDEPVKTFENPTPGQALEFTDVLPTVGVRKYTVLPYTAAGVGRQAQVSGDCGPSTPKKVENLTVTETDVKGTVTLRWDEVTEDRNNVVLNPGLITYSVSTYNGDKRIDIADNLTTNTFTCKVCEESEQGFMSFDVRAKTERGNGAVASCEMRCYGTPYTSLHETFADKSFHYAWYTSTSGMQTEWEFRDDEDLLYDILSYEHDNGYFYINHPRTDYSGYFLSGKIDLSSLENPALMFQLYNKHTDKYGGLSPNEVNVYVVRADGSETKLFSKTAAEIFGGSGAQEGWYEVVVPFTDMKDETVQFKIESVNKGYTFTLFDGVKIFSLVNHDLAAGTVSAPGTAHMGTSYEVGLTVLNEGYLPAEDYSVEIYRGEELAATIPGVPVAMKGSHTFTTTFAMDHIAENPVEYSARIVYADDEVPENNAFESFVVSPLPSNLPAVRDIAGSMDNGVASLTWTAPDATKGPGTPVTEDFESGTSFGRSFSGWTFVDRDHALINVSGEFVYVPGLSLFGDATSYMVFDRSEEHFTDNERLTAHSGDKYLFTFADSNWGEVDDWAISPELYPGGQTISFWGRSYNAHYREKVRVLYSTGSLEPDDFVEVATIDAVNPEWTLYSADIPAGAKYFAINSCGGPFNYHLMIDDVTYIPVDAPSLPLELLGYHVYRDGERINEEMLTTTEFTDDTAEVETDYTYKVYAVFDKGVSAPSKPVELYYTTRTDLLVRQISTPESVYEGESYNVEFRVVNVGRIPAESYTATIYVDDEPVQTFTGTGMAIGEERVHSAVLVMSSDSPDEVCVKAVVDPSNDMNPDDNTSPTVMVKKLVRSGVDSVKAGVKVTATAGCITVSGTSGEGVVIAAADGKVISNAEGDVRVEVVPGVYVVRVGDTVEKVIVP